MTTEHEIGRVVAIDTAHVSVELNNDLKALTRSTYEGSLEVGRINSYVIIPVGVRRIVAMVTRVMLTEEGELRADKTMIALPSARRLMRATMIGSIDDSRFRQGIDLFPVLDSKVYLTTKDDLDSIFGHTKDQIPVDPERPGYCISIGRSVVFPDYDIRIDPDAFFGKHAAIIGSTGSGKSCSIATVLQSILSRGDVKKTRFVILDTNGEYRAAFQKSAEMGSCRLSLHIPTDPHQEGHLAIPYWFMDSDDFVRLFRAAPGVQRPILLNALTLARQHGVEITWTALRDTIIQECQRVLGSAASGTWQDKQTIRVLCRGAESALKGSGNQAALAKLKEVSSSLTDPSEIFKRVLATIPATGDENKDYSPITMEQRQKIEALVREFVSELSTAHNPLETGLASADRPLYFSKTTFQRKHLETAITREQANSGRTRDNCATMLTRIYRLLEDSRFDFLFGPCSEEWPVLRHGLATFLRDILGLESAKGVVLTDEEHLASGRLPFYDRQRRATEPSNVVVVDLSLLASEVLENVTALLGRLIHEFLQRLGEAESGVERGEFPVVLVLEEAQNYIREDRRSEEESISKQVFERIAREGRKFGLGLVVASQRPSELSKTVLSQCNSFIVHRLQNPEDLRYFREIVPGIYGQLLDQLPALAPRCALVLGECVQAPVLAEMRTANPVPRSKNPQFYKSWTTAGPSPNVERVCEKWEGTGSSEGAASKAPTESPARKRRLRSSVGTQTKSGEE